MHVRAHTHTHIPVVIEQKTAAWVKRPLHSWPSFRSGNWQSANLVSFPMQFTDVSSMGFVAALVPFVAFPDWKEQYQYNVKFISFMIIRYEVTKTLSSHCMHTYTGIEPAMPHISPITVFLYWWGKNSCFSEPYQDELRSVKKINGRHRTKVSKMSVRDLS